jgi:hypothetical protein
MVMACGLAQQIPNERSKDMKKLAAVLVIIGLVGILATGCATTPKGPTDQEQISKRIQEGVSAIKAKNWNSFEGMISASFSSSAVPDKASLLVFLKNADTMGYLENLDIDLSAAEINVQGDKATVTPVTANGNFGSITLDFTGVKEKGVWVVNGLEGI